MSQVEVLDETGRFTRTERVQQVVTAYLDANGLAGRELTVVLLGDAAIAEHNERDRGVPGPTDVLSYPTHEPDGTWFPGVAHLGDVLISLDTAERQAIENGHSLASEVLVLVAHSVTHLLGFDHQDEEEWRPFNAAQAGILDLAAGMPEDA